MEGDTASVVPQFVRDNLLLVIIGCIGLGLLSTSLFLLLSPKEEQVTIETSSNTDKSGTADISPPSTKIVVDIEGAVVHPGMYNLASTSRVQDAIAIAGGLSTKADRGQVAKQMNLAAKLSDGMKLYIPFVGETAAAAAGQSIAGVSSVSVSVNSASASELDSLPGVGPVTAQKIISSRPYSALDDLVSKKAVSQSVFEKIKDQISL